MTQNKNLLFISHRIPYPPDKGDKIRTFNEVKYLSERFTIDLAALADNPDDLTYKKELARYCRSVHIFPLRPIQGKIRGLKTFFSGHTITRGYFFNPLMKKTIDMLLSKERYHAVFCFSSSTAQYVDTLENVNSSTPHPRLIMDFCDVDSEKWNQYSFNTSFPMNLIYKKESQRLLEYEKEINTRFDVSVFVSENETELFNKLAPGAKHTVTVSNGVDFTYFSPDASARRKKDEPPVILFTGAMDYYANMEGVTWFCETIFPKIKARIPEALFYIVGSNPPASVQKLSRGNDIFVTGFVKDIRPFYKKADVCVIPLRIARGVQNKVLEAMAMGKPVVSTTSALDGIKAENGRHLVRADAPDDIAEAVIRLLNDPSGAESLGTDARKFVEQEYSWERCLEKLDTVLQG